MATVDAVSSSTGDRGPAAFVVATTTLALATIFVAALLAWFLAFAVSFTIDLGTRNGLGRHDDAIPTQDWATLRRCEYTFSVLYNPALMATKTSILIFYLRLSRNTEQVLRLASWAVLAIVNVAGAVLTLLNIFQCRPVQAAWDPTNHQAHCIPLLVEFTCSAPVNIVTDLAILALPIPVLTGMRLPTRQKIILILTFAVAIFVTVVDVVRIYYLQSAITEVNDTTFGGEAEFSWNASFSFMWSAVEVNVGIMCACVPTLKPLFIRILPAMIIDPHGTQRSTSEKQPSDDSRHVNNENRSPALNIVPEEQQSSSETQGFDSSPERGMTAMQFLTSAIEPDATSRSDALHTSASRGTDSEHSVYFGFVNMKRPKSLVKTSVSESFKYCSMVTVLFLLWGFSYGLLNMLNNAVAAVADMSLAETIGLTSIYFGGGYFFGPLVVGEWLLRHDEHSRTRKRASGTPSVGGFKATFMLGLCIYGVGTIMLWPSAVLTSFAGFMISNFVVGFGLAVLETAANPFLAFCGPRDYAEMRLLIAQGVQAVATVLSGLLAQKVLFTDINSQSVKNSTMLHDVQWTYLAVTLFVSGLALFFYYMPLPEVTDMEMEQSILYLPVDPRKRSILGLQLRTWTLILAVLAQWAYVAGQESMSIFFGDLLMPKSSSSSANLTLSISDYLLVAHTAFAVSRFMAAYLAYLSPTHSKLPQPRTILNICACLCIVFAILTAALRPQNPNALAVPIILFFFAEGPMWPLIYTLGLRGQGKRMKRAAAFITMGASGPAFWPFVVYAINRAGASYQTAFAVVPAFLVFTVLFALFLDVKHDARKMVDARVGALEQARFQATQDQEIPLESIVAERQRRSSSSAKMRSMSLSTLGKKFPASLFPFRRKLSEPAMVEHREDGGRKGSGQTV